MSSFFLRLYQFFSRQRALFWSLLVLVFLSLGWIASEIALEEDVSKLIPKTAENEQLQQVLNTAKFSDRIVIHIEKSEAGTAADMTDYATAITDSLSTNFTETVKEVQGAIDEDAALEIIDFVYENLPLFLDPADYEQIKHRLNADSIHAITQANYETLISPTGIVAKKTIARDPLAITFQGMQQLKSLNAADDFILKDGFLMSQDEKHLLLFVTPAYATSETAKNEAFVTQLYQLQEALNRVYAPRATASVYGGILIAVANARQIKIDIQYTVGISVLVLLVVFVLFYKRWFVPIILFIPTLFGALLSVSVLFVLRGEISAISLGIGSVLLGVTLDYSLHILTHIRNGETPAVLFTSVAKPIIMSSLSTAIAFLCLLFIDSQALQDLGIFAAMSVLGAAFFALVFIPQVNKHKGQVLTNKNLIDRIAGYPFQNKKVAIALVILALITSIFTYNKVVFNKDLSTLNFVPEHLEDAENKLDDLMKTRARSLYVVSYGDSLETALAANDEVLKKLIKLKTTNQDVSFNSVGGLVTSRENQLLKIKRWQSFWNGERTDSLTGLLERSGATFGFKSASFAQFFEQLSTNFEPLSLSDYAEIPSLAVTDFVSETPEFTTVTTIVKVSEAHSEAIKTTFQHADNILVVDRLAMNETLLGNLKDQFNQLIVYSLLGVFLLLIVFYRNIKLALVTIIPIVLTWVITIGIMGLLGLKFNVFNVIISTFIFGLGVDYCIFMTNGLRSENKGNLSTLKSHKTAVLLSVITTILGVGVLIFAKHPALYSIAWVAVIGIITALFVSFTIQPLLYQFLIFRKESN